MKIKNKTYYAPVNHYNLPKEVKINAIRGEMAYIEYNYGNGNLIKTKMPKVLLFENEMDLLKFIIELKENFNNEYGDKKYSFDFDITQTSNNKFEIKMKGNFDMFCNKYNNTVSRFIQFEYFDDEFNEYKKRLKEVELCLTKN